MTLATTTRKCAIWSSRGVSTSTATLTTKQSEVSRLLKVRPVDLANKTEIYRVVACKGAAKMLFTGTLTLGCKAYIDAQKKACYCAPAPAYGWKDKKNYKYTRGDEL
jgi:hypothetical protein